MIRLVYMVVLGLSLAAGASAQAADFIRFEEVRIHEGDDAGYAMPAFDDANWMRVAPHEIDPQGRIMWVRAYVDGARLSRSAEKTPLGFFHAALASREIYFNGVMIGASGAPGAAPRDEIPGALDAVYFIPPELIRPKTNVFAIRISSHHLGARVGWPVHSFHVAPYEGATERRLRGYFPAIAAGGAIALGAIYFLGFFAANRRSTASLALGVLALAVVGQLAAEIWRAFDHYLYPLHMLRLYVMLGFAALAGGALSLFATLRFAPDRLALISAGAVIAASAAVFLARGYDAKIGLAILAFMTAALIAAAIGVFERRRGAVFAAAGFAAFLTAALIAPVQFLDQTYYLAMAALIMVLFVMQIRLLRAERRSKEAAALQAVRLRHELLKRQIQPHFLMNTLTTLSEWIESDPKTGVRMIDALSEELRLLYDMSEKKLVPLADELQLCRQHLDVMSLRAGVNYELRVTDEIDGAACPPATLLTLIENAFTHNEYRDDAVFEVSAARKGPHVVITCHTPLRALDNCKKQSGAGLAYVRARLTEAFGERWSLRSEAAPGNVWATTLSWTAT